MLSDAFLRSSSEIGMLFEMSIASAYSLFCDSACALTAGTKAILTRSIAAKIELTLSFFFIPYSLLFISQGAGSSKPQIFAKLSYPCLRATWGSNWIWKIE